VLGARPSARQAGFPSRVRVRAAGAARPRGGVARMTGRVRLGIDRLLAEAPLRAPLRGRRVALLAHPASVTEDLTHSLDALAVCGDVTLTAAFGPQHGLRGDKQDNMI